MTNNFLLALQITALGMGLVFAAILLLWGMMTLLTFITTAKEPTSNSVESPSGRVSASVADDEFKAQAAAVAVAIALAERHISMEMSSAHPLTDPPTAIISAWQLGMRTRQMYQKGVSIRRSTKQDDR